MDDSAHKKSFRLDERVWRDLGILPGDSKIRPAAINNSDWVVGTSEGPGEAQRPFLYVDGKLYDLNDLIPANSGWTLITASDLNNRGEITPYGFHQGTRGFGAPAGQATPALTVLG